MQAYQIEHAAGKVADLMEQDLEDLCRILDGIKRKAEAELSDRRTGAKTWERWQYRSATASDFASERTKQAFVAWAVEQRPMVAPADAWEVWKAEHADWKTMFEEPDTEFLAQFRSRRKQSKVAKAATREFLRRQEAYVAARKEAVHA